MGSMTARAPHPHAPDRRERRKQEIHARLLDAARTLFEQKGFAATTVDEICARADVAQKTFFNHFPTKHHVVREIAEAFLDELGALVEEARKQPGPTPDRLAYLFDRVAEQSLHARPRLQELLVEVVRAAVLESRRESASRVHAAFRALLEDGAAAGDLTPDHDVAFLTEMVVGTFSTILLNWQTLEGYSLRERLAEAARFLGRAISRQGATRRR